MAANVYQSDDGRSYVVVPLVGDGECWDRAYMVFSAEGIPPNAYRCF